LLLFLFLISNKIKSIYCYYMHVVENKTHSTTPFLIIRRQRAEAQQKTER
jgi:hypothetical protein